MQVALRRYSDEVRCTQGLVLHVWIGLNAGDVSDAPLDAV